MKFFVIILTLGLASFLQMNQEQTIMGFSEAKLPDYTVDKAFKGGKWYNWVEKYNLHEQKIEIGLKAKQPHSNANSYNLTVYSRIQISQFDFATKDRCGQVIDALLNCFPYNCAKLTKNKDQGIKITQSIWILTEKHIYIAQTACEQVDEKWIRFRKDFVEAFADVETEIIVTECGNLTWMTKEKILSGSQ